MRRHLDPHVYAIQESGELTTDALGRLGKQESTARALLDGFKNAKEYGSILQPKVTLAELDALQEQLREVDGASDMGSLTDQLVAGQIVNVLYPLIEQARMLVQKYDVVVTNPPYMGGSGMNARLSDYVKKYYPDSKSDLFAVFIERCAQMDKRGGYQAMITQHAWMFLSSFEKLRAKLQLIDTVNMAHLGARGFDEIGGEVVQTTSFVMRSSHTKGYKGTYCRLIDGDSEKAKAEMFVSGENRYVTEQDNFSKIPGSPVAYWVGNGFISIFSHKETVGTFCYPKQGLHTGNNDTYLRLWYEVDNRKIMLDDSNLWDNKSIWAKLNKGGYYRKWYGNREYIILWENNGAAIKNNGRSVGANNTTFLQNMIGFTDISSRPSFRYYGKGFVYDVSGPSMINSQRVVSNEYLLGLLNSKICDKVMDILSPTIHMNQTALSKMSVVLNNKKEVECLANKNIQFSKSDWDSFETSWDFKRHPLV